MIRAILLLLAVSLQAAEPLQLHSLDGPWRTHAGDDARWAARDFDDSGWESRLPSAPRVGFAWYRRSIPVPQGLTGPISLWFPRLRAETEVYANGRLVLRYGEPGKWYTDRRGPVPVIDLPEASPGGEVTVALRAYATTGSSDWQPPLLGSQRGIALAAREDRSEKLRRHTAWLGVGLLNLLFAFAALFIWRDQRDQPVYFWFAVVNLSQGIYAVSRFFVNCLNVPVAWLLPGDLIWGSEIAAWLFLFRGDSVWPGWRRFWPFLAVTSFTCIYFSLSYTGILEADWIHPIMVPILLATVMAAWRAVRLDSSKRLLFYAWLIYEAGQIVISARLAWAVLGGRKSSDDGLILIRTPFELNLLLIGSVLSVIAMSALLLARFTRVEKERQMYASEWEAARQVQDLLVPASAVRVPGFEIGSIYLPAQRVGGDFFQVLPAPDGAALVIAGDVSGKGLRAAMVVSLVVGVFRNRRSNEPGAILGELNGALAGQLGGGFVTCCCARFAADGGVTVANAGHLAPYVNGVEEAVETGLPLGLVAEASYEQTPLTLEPGSMLTLVSDGVVEAENAQRELFGFDRTREISSKPAQEIAEAAKAWGQNDDITVVTVRRSV